MSEGQRNLSGTADYMIFVSSSQRKNHTDREFFERGFFMLYKRTLSKKHRERN